MSKVLIITNIPSPYRVDLFHYMQSNIKEHIIHVLYTSKNEDNRVWTVSEEKMQNTHILNSPVLKMKNKWDTRYIHLPMNIIKTIDDIAPDVIVAMEYNPAALQALLWAKLHRKGFVHWTDGTLNSERNIGVVQKISRKIICLGADTCIASSTKAKEKLLAWNVPEEKIHISYLTVDTTKYALLERMAEPGRLLYVGSMVKRKGLDLLLEALAKVRKPFTLRIVGNGTEKEKSELEQMALSLGIADKIVWCGFLEGEALLGEYRKAELFILPTREDCFGLVLLEAMCAGLPIVASKYADGAYDTVEVGRNGYIADPFSPEEFAETIDRALEACCTMTTSTEQVEKFTFENVAAAYIHAVECAL